MIVVNTLFLETFVKLAELRSFRKTAQAVGRTPAAISAQIKSLEIELGPELIDRSGKKFRLTPQGEELLDYAKTVVAAEGKMRAVASRKDPLEGRVRVGVMETVVHTWLSRFIKQLSRDCPKLEIDLAVDIGELLKRRLLDEELDLIVRVEAIDHPNITSTALAAYPVQWIAHKDLVPPRSKALIQWVLQQPLLTFARGTAPQRELERIVANLANQKDIRVSQTRITCSPSVAAIVRLVADGYGIAAIPGLFVTGYLASGEFVKLPSLPVLPPITVTLCHHTNAKEIVRAAARVAKQACTEFGQQFNPGLMGGLCPIDLSGGEGRPPAGPADAARPGQRDRARSSRWR